jgi:hypothetical protein
MLGRDRGDVLVHCRCRILGRRGRSGDHHQVHLSVVAEHRGQRIFDRAARRDRDRWHCAFREYQISRRWHARAHAAQQLGRQLETDHVHLECVARRRMADELGGFRSVTHARLEADEPDHVCTGERPRQRARSRLVIDAWNGVRARHFVGSS